MIDYFYCSVFLDNTSIRGKITLTSHNIIFNSSQALIDVNKLTIIKINIDQIQFICKKEVTHQHSETCSLTINTKKENYNFGFCDNYNKLYNLLLNYMPHK